MALHIEIDGDASPREWEALAAFVAIMRNAPGCAVGHSEPSPVKPSPIMPEQMPDPAARTMSEAVTAGLLNPEAPVQAQMAQTAAAVAAGAVLDSAGLPWDARIHASTKSKNKDETWKSARNLDPAMKAAVEAELRAVMAATPETPATVAVPAPPPPADDAPTVVDPAAAFPGNVVALPGTNAAPAATVPNGPNATNGAFPSDLAGVMRVVLDKQAAGLSTEDTTGFVQALGLTGLADLAKRPDLIPAFMALLP